MQPDERILVKLCVTIVGVDTEALEANKPIDWVDDESGVDRCLQAATLKVGDGQEAPALEFIWGALIAAMRHRQTTDVVRAFVISLGLAAFMTTHRSGPMPEQVKKRWLIMDAMMSKFEKDGEEDAFMAIFLELWQGLHFIGCTIDDARTSACSGSHTKPQLSPEQAGDIVQEGCDLLDQELSVMLYKEEARALSFGLGDWFRKSRQKLGLI